MRLLLILAGSIFKKPTLPVMMASTVLAGAEALIFQNINLKNLLLATVKGFKISMLTTRLLLLRRLSSC